MSVSKLTDIAAKALVGTEKLAPETLAATRKLVTESGRIRDGALGKRKMLGNLLIGKRGAGDAIKARYTQGGVIGPGGLILGELAFDPRYRELIRGIKASRGGQSVVNPYTGEAVSRAKAVRTALGKGATESINPLFLLAFPAMEISEAARLDEADPLGGTSGMLRALGGAAGFAAAGPLGLLGGMTASSLGSRLGESVGGLFDKKNTDSLAEDAVGEGSPTPNIALDAALPK